MNCKQCQIENPADNKFCRECGTLLVSGDAVSARDELMRRQAKVAESLTDALRLRDKGLFKEAIIFAEEASRLLPESTRALALLTSLYEHEGQWDKAIFAMERIVALTPDSIADREKLGELRRRAHLPVQTPATKPKKTESESTIPGYLPMVAAGGIAAIVFFSLLPLFGHKKPVVIPTPVATVMETPAPAKTFDPITPLREAIRPDDAPSDPFTRQRPVHVPVPSASVSDDLVRLPDDTAAPARRTRVARRTEATPMPITAIPPMPVSPPTNTDSGMLPSGTTADNGNTANISPRDNGFGSGERITARPPSNTDTGQSQTADNGRQSYIYIKVHPAPASSGKGEPTPAPPRSENSTQSSADTTGNSTGNSTADNRDLDRARVLQGTGHYAEAIRAYRDALSNGVRGDAYQGIAQSYQRIGDAESARASYKDAIHAYEQERSFRPRLAQQGIATCEAALFVLGG